MNVHVLQHVPFEGIGSMEPWLQERGARITYTRFYEAGWTLPDLEDEAIDLIIAMGGPMSVNDERELLWLVPEKQFIREAVQEGVAVLGICLGAQLIASAFGARVYPGPQREIGWFDINATSAAESVFRFPSALPVFHWHGETFDLPVGAVRLASSAVCANQAFQLGRNVIGLQFHLETTPVSADAIIENCRNELVPADYVQSEPQLRGGLHESGQGINLWMSKVLGYLTREA